MGHAAQHGLQYLSEADFSEVMPTRFDPEVVKDLQKMSASLIETEQYMDFLKNKTFRQTLLCHAEQPVRRALSTEHITQFLFSTRARAKSKKPIIRKQSVERFVAQDEAEFATDHPLTKAAFVHLARVDPLSVPFDQLVAKAAKMCRLPADADMEKESTVLAANLLRAFSYSNNLIMFRRQVPHFTTKISERPMVSPVTRWQSGNAVYVTNVYHERIELEDFSRVVLGYLDGRHSRDDIVEKMIEHYKEGGFKVTLKDKGEAPSSQVPRLLKKDLEGRLQAIALSALLIR
jgi:methyltransferase-like protein